MGTALRPAVSDLRRHVGVAGQIAISVLVSYPDEVPYPLTFVGSPSYGGPVVMIDQRGFQCVVTDPSRFGPFGKEWVRKFLGEA